MTQFELLTAAALWEMAEQGVEVAVIEAGLGGRYDATNVISSQMTVLTNVGLEHTALAGADARGHRRREARGARARARRSCSAPTWRRRRWRWQGPWLEARDARVVIHLGRDGPAAPLLAGRAFQQRNFALARAAAETYLKDPAGVAGDDKDRRGRRRPRAGRARGGGVHRGARAPAGDRRRPADRARRGAQPRRGGGARRFAPGGSPRAPTAVVLGVLEDKDAAGMLRRCWECASARGSPLPPAAARCLPRRCSRSHASSASIAVACEPEPWEALEQARRWASERGGAVLATGSVYLVGDLLVARRRRRLPGPRPPRSSAR